jgi:hypothetical protein
MPTFLPGAMMPAPGPASAHAWDDTNEGAGRRKGNDVPLRE